MNIKKKKTQINQTATTIMKNTIFEEIKKKHLNIKLNVKLIKVTFRIPCKNLYQEGQKCGTIERKMETKQLRRLIKTNSLFFINH